ncbi:hypothetical protein E4U59_000088, partial [Claviceps monticola]
MAFWSQMKITAQKFSSPAQRQKRNQGCLSSHENAENDREAALGADSELQRVPPLPRRRVLDYVPRRRNNDELREVVEGEDCDLTDLWGPGFRDRDHLPPPEVMYDSLDAAVAG